MRNANKTILISSFLSLVWAAPKVDLKELSELKREVEVLELIKKRKLDSLEMAEGQRWNLRFGQREELRLLEDKSKRLENVYSRQAGEMSRRQEDLISMRNLSEETEQKLDDVKQKLGGFKLQVKQAIEKNSEELSSDFPFEITDRVLDLSKGLEALDGENPDFSKSIDLYMGQRISRAAMTSNQSVETRSSLFQKGGERTVWSLRLGSVFYLDVDKSNGEIQSLFRTGALQGKLFTWKNSFTQEYSDEVRSLVENSNEKSLGVSIPLDVLQNGKFGKSIPTKEQDDFTEKASKWFATGGLVMYPLMLSALLALLLSLERGLRYRKRMKKLNKTRKELLPLIRSGKWEQIATYCEQNKSTTSEALLEIVENRELSRKSVEQKVRKVLLSEIPSLEKRLGLISSLGASAPLMGLLGTVSGMITLFQIITDVGTNDARILAGGISEALVTTQTGLVVAIPILLVHGYLSENLDDLISKLNETVMEALNLVWPEAEDKA